MASQPTDFPGMEWESSGLGCAHVPREVGLFHRRAGGGTPPHFIVDVAAVAEEGNRPCMLPLRRHHPLSRYGPRSLRCEVLQQRGIADAARWRRTAPGRCDLAFPLPIAGR